MSVIIQWIIAAIIVVASAGYLIYRLWPRKDACGGCSGRCSECKIANQMLEKCEEIKARTNQKQP